MKKPAILAFALVAVPAIFAWGWVRDGLSRPPERAIADRPVQIPEDGYASSKACQACHPSQYAAWHTSYHRTMTQVATPESVVADFDRVRVDAVPGRPMLLERRGRELWAEFDQPDWDGKGNAPPRISRRVVMTTGSHHQQIYWYATGHDRVLGQLPAIQLLADKRWIPRYAATMHPPGISCIQRRELERHRVQCHTTLGRPDQHAIRFGELFSQNDTKAVNSAFRARRAGPGGTAANAARCAVRTSPDRRPDPTIVQRFGSIRALIAGVRAVPRVGVLRPDDRSQANSGGLPFRPGDELGRRVIVQPTRNMDSPTLKTLLADDPCFERHLLSDGGFARRAEFARCSVAVTGREKDARTMSCFSCHTMHQGRAMITPQGMGPGPARTACEGKQPGVRAVPSGVGARRRRAHQASRRFGGELLLQLPHAVYQLRIAEDNAQPPDQQSDGAGDASDRPAQCL